MPHKLPKYVKIVHAKGRAYYYFDTGQKADGKRIYTRLPDLRSLEFGGAYAACMGHRTRGRTASDVIRVPRLVDLYQRGKDYKDMKASSQRLYDIALRKLEKLLPTAPVSRITRLDMRKLIDGMADTPGAANTFKAVSGALFKWAIEHEYMSANPVEGIEPIPMGEHEEWPEPVLDAALATDDDRVRLLTHLLYFTAQRINDVLSMRWTDISDGRITVTQRKTGKVLSIPLHEDLEAELVKTPRRGLIICTNSKGLPLHEETARQALKAFCAERGTKRVPHGLRKNAVNALLEAGCSIAETAAISGQSLRMVEHYAKGRDQRKLSTAAVLKWQGTTRERSNIGKTAK